MLELNKIYNMDCKEGLKLLDDNSIDSIVTDPPYELGFMNKKWDKSGISYDVEMWKECFRVLKPGGYLLSFGGTRTYHRMVCAIEDAGFIIHPMIAWIFGTGFPKATDLSLQLDKQACRKELTDELGRKPTNEEFGRAWEEYRKVVGKSPYSANRSNSDIGYNGTGHNEPERLITAPATDAAKQWDGWYYGLQSLKPAIEPICMAQKPIDGKRMTDNVRKWGVGAIHVDECRVGTDMITSLPSNNKENHHYAQDEWTKSNPIGKKRTYEGRFPANIILDEEAAAMLDGQSGISQSKKSMRGVGLSNSGVYGKGDLNFDTKRGHNDFGGASRFFYCAKASKKERGEGNNHPTVKPIKLIEYLVKLITPPDGISLDPFMGSGTHALVCKKLNRNYIGFEISKEYCDIAEKRIESSSEDSKSENKNGDQITIWY